MENNWLSMSEVAQILGVDKQTATIYCNKGMIPFLRLAGLMKVDVQDLLEFLKKSKSNSEIRAVEVNIKNYLYERNKNNTT